MKFTFKTTKPTGRYRSFYSPSHDIKLKGKVCGAIDNETYKIRLMVMKNGYDIVDNNPNCEWKWVTLARNNQSLDDAKAWLNDRLPSLLEKYTLKLS